MKKRVVALLIAIFISLPFGLLVNAASPSVVLSPQSVMVDGTKIRFEVYNIDGYNYFKLRDMAYVLNGTESQFGVSFDATLGMVLVTTGESYIPVGGEMVIGVDKSSTAVKSTQKLYIDGKIASISSYNIGGNNFFKLRELGDALGFGVDFDIDTGTVLITSEKKKTPLTAEGIYAKCAPAVCYIETYNEKGQKISTGSGCFISSDGLLVTNWHVIKGAAAAIVTIPDTGKQYEVAGICDCDEKNDAALLRVNGGKFPYLNIGTPDTIVGGAVVYAIGSPLGMQSSISEGIISNPSRLYNGVYYIQSTAPISSGSSGGALINKFGEVIGITTATLLSDQGVVQNINLSIPITVIENFNRGSYTPLSDSGVTLPRSLSLKRTSVTLPLGATMTMTASITPFNAANKSITWTTSDKNVATVSDTGKVTAIAPGTTTITATTVNGLKASCTVTVEKSSKITYINITSAEVTLNKGEQTKVNIEVVNPQSLVYTLTCQNPDKRIVSVKWGGWVGDTTSLTLTGMSSGQVIIKVYLKSDPTIYDTVIVTVN